MVKVIMQPITGMDYCDVITIVANQKAAWREKSWRCFRLLIIPC